MKTPFAEIEANHGSPLEISYSMSKLLRTHRVGERGMSRWTITLHLCTEDGVSTVAEVKLCAVKLGRDYREVHRFESSAPDLYRMLESTFQYWNRYDYTQLIAVESVTVAEEFRGLGVGPYLLSTALDELASDSTIVLLRVDDVKRNEVAAKIKRAVLNAGFKKLRGANYVLDCGKPTAGVAATASRIRKDQHRKLALTVSGS